MTKRASRSERKNPRMRPAKRLQESATPGGNRNANEGLVKEPEDYKDKLDIVCGQDMLPGQNLSNCLYLYLICEYGGQFRKASDREKVLIATDLVEHARAQQGRFLRKMDDGSESWFDVGNQVAVAKTFRQLSLVAERENCKFEDFLAYNAFSDEDDSADNLAWAQVSGAFKEHHDQKINETATSNQKSIAKKTPVEYKAASNQKSIEKKTPVEYKAASNHKSIASKTPVEYRATAMEDPSTFEQIDDRGQKPIITRNTIAKPSQPKINNNEDSVKPKNAYFIDEETRRGYEKLLSTPQKRQLDQLRSLKGSDIKAATKIITIPEFTNPRPDYKESDRAQASSTPPYTIVNTGASKDDDIDYSIGLDTPQSATDYPSPAPDGGWYHPVKRKPRELSARQAFLSPIKPPKRQTMKNKQQDTQKKSAPGSPPPPPKIERKISGASKFLVDDPNSALPFLPNDSMNSANVLPKPLEYLAYMAETQRSPFNVKKYLLQHPGAFLPPSPFHPLRLAEIEACTDVPTEDGRNACAAELSNKELRYSLYSHSIPEEHECGSSNEDGRDNENSNNEAAASPLRELNTSVSQDLACQKADEDDACFYMREEGKCSKANAREQSHTRKPQFTDVCSTD